MIAVSETHRDGAYIDVGADSDCINIITVRRHHSVSRDTETTDVCRNINGVSVTLRAAAITPVAETTVDIGFINIGTDDVEHRAPLSAKAH